MSQMVIVFSLAAALFGCGGSDGGSKGSSAGSGTIFTATISSEGGRITVPISDETIGGSLLSIPAGAISSETVISVQGDTLAWDGSPPRTIAENEPEVHLAVVAHALNHLDDALMHPLYGPLFGLSSAEFAGPAFLLEPAGQQFTEAVELTIPLSVLGIKNPETALPLLRSENGEWQVLDEFAIDMTAGIATVKVPHFSVLQWIRNLVVAPQRIAAVFAVGTVLEAHSRLPQDTFNKFVTGTVCSKFEPEVNLNKIPGLPTLLDYLAFEKVGLRSGHENELILWIRKQFDEARTGKLDFHSISLGELFQEAMKLNQGDIFLSLVTAHNALRDNRDSPSVQDMIENYRGDGGDEKGARYHFFGMALYSFAFEHFMELAKNRGYVGAQALIGIALRPEIAATIEESVVSGDIVSDVTEYAVDLQGAKIGRRLFREVFRSKISELASRFGVNPAQCTIVSLPAYTGVHIKIIVNGTFHRINFFGSSDDARGHGFISLEDAVGSFSGDNWTGTWDFTDPPFFAAGHYTGTFEATFNRSDGRLLNYSIQREWVRESPGIRSSSLDIISGTNIPKGSSDSYTVFGEAVCNHIDSMKYSLTIDASNPRSNSTSELTGHSCDEKSELIIDFR